LLEVIKAAAAKSVANICATPSTASFWMTGSLVVSSLGTRPLKGRHFLDFYILTFSHYLSNA
jgi:hypothetical protein